MVCIRPRDTGSKDRQGPSAEPGTFWPKLATIAIISADPRSEKIVRETGRIEQCFFKEHVLASLADLSVEVQREAAVLGQGLHSDSAAELADLERVMNCYYSNLIDGHHTRPRDIVCVLAGAELEAETRPLALEALAHVIVQRSIDKMLRDGTLARPTSVAFVSWVHKAFYDEMPDEFRRIEHPDGSSEPIIPGRMRPEGDSDVAVGRQLPPSSGRVAAFMDHFDKRFRSRPARRAEGSLPSARRTTGSTTSIFFPKETGGSAA